MSRATRRALAVLAAFAVGVLPACGGDKHYAHKTILWTPGPLRQGQLVDAARIVKARLARLRIPSYVRTLDGDRLTVETQKPEPLVASVGSPGSLGVYAASDFADCDGGGGGPPPLVPSHCPHGVPRPALANGDIAAARAADDPATGQPVVLIDVDRAGRRKLARLIRRVAATGRRTGRPAHLWIVLDNFVRGAPFIDYRAYPNGLSPANGLQLAVESRSEARVAAALLSTRPLPARFSVRG